MQTHTMVLWSTPSNLDTDSYKQQTYSLLTTLKTFGPELSPKYITSRKKATAQEFGFTLADLEQLLRKGANREGDYAFPELGCRVSFFSSLKDEDSAAISLTIGVSDLRFKNTFVVRFPQSYDLGNAQLRNRTVE